MYHLIIGNKNYSSWSLRPWLLLEEKKLSFKETLVPLNQETSKQEMLKYSPAGKVPIFFHNDLCIWDSLAICEYVAERHPEKHCWPQNSTARARARSISNEMHSGFINIRTTLPMDCKISITFDEITEELQTEIDRICEIWRGCRSQQSTAGEFLFGAFSIADAMFAPVVLRFKSYGIQVGAVEQAYMDSILGLESVKSWVSKGLQEAE